MLLRACFGGRPAKVRLPAVEHSTESSAAELAPDQDATAAANNARMLEGSATPSDPQRPESLVLSHAPQSQASASDSSALNGVPSGHAVPGTLTSDSTSRQPPLLCMDLLQGSPYLQTAFTLDGQVYQTPRSIRYFGDLEAETAAAGPEARANLVSNVLQRLLRMEGESVLQEMQAAIFGAPLHSDAEVVAEWRRVVRVPQSCCQAPNQAAHQPSQWEGASAMEREDAEELVQHGSHGAMMYVRRDTLSPRVTTLLCSDIGCGSSLDLFDRSSTVTGTNMVNSTMEDLVVGSPMGPLRKGHASCQSHRYIKVTLEEERGGSAAQLPSSLLTSTGEASALSVGVRNAPQRIKSLMDLSYASRSAALSSPQMTRSYLSSNLSSAYTETTAFVQSEQRSLQDTGKLFSRSAINSATLPSEIRTRSQRHLSILARPSSSERKLKTIASSPDGSQDAPLSPSLNAAPVIQSSAIGSAAQTGSLSELLAAGLRSDNEYSKSSFPSASYGGNLQSGVLATLAMPPDATAVRPTPHAQYAENTIECSGSSSSSLPTYNDTQCYSEEEAPCWHEVHITRSRRSPDREVIMVYQSDVSTRTQLETTMASLTELQLNTLAQVFPRHVIEFMATGGDMSQLSNLSLLARSHRDASVLFMDIVGFTTMSKQLAPAAVMTFINSLFTLFDDLCSTHKVHKLETAGDCYIVSSGLLNQDGEGFAQVAEDHDPAKSAARLLAFAKDMLIAASQVCMPHDNSPVSIRIGIHTGPCVSGVIGSKLPKFGVFGDTMNTASRMESTCPHGRIQVSAFTHSLLLASGTTTADEWQATGGIPVKGKGMMDTFLHNPITTAASDAEAEHARSTPSAPLLGLALSPAAQGPAQPAAGRASYDRASDKGHGPCLASLDLATDQTMVRKRPYASPTQVTLQLQPEVQQDLLGASTWPGKLAHVQPIGGDDDKCGPPRTSLSIHS